MSFYETARHFADSYGLIFLAGVFVLLCAWVFRPGSRRHYDDAAMLPFEDDKDGE
ncbi:cbb3-type cytochrome c oxidase subunit 3 [Croceicoccus sp. F390]|uniref:Cbb3-type cytochrome c oxidase subunit 3 n=1 Tax=Croceicoccus esteveae TaxID=3075597 RepID=A0ABU2ZEB2_9SPHN|nr:cbb3-type cytochrome c oxidase subunit 3 [Croceicoccus sp. F390]MDT0574943.1 cbb3-type cytochrome c oxidase subunit 3 [Croceicoccus sp. F390]